MSADEGIAIGIAVAAGIGVILSIIGWLVSMQVRIINHEERIERLEKKQ